MSWTRRRVLGCAVGASVGAVVGLAARPARALGDATGVDIAEIQLSRGTISRSEAWKRLLLEVVQTTSIEVHPRAVQLDPEDPDLFRHPFAVLSGNAALPELSDAARAQVVRYLAYGGFLFIDDATGTIESDFDRSVRSMLARLFPTRPLAVLPSDHSIYRSFFLLHEPVGRVANHRVLEGVPQGSTHVVVYGRDDLSGALDRRPDGGEAASCVPDGELQRREAIKLGVNLVMYALTSNYKQDMAHVNELMRDGRLE